MPVEHLWPVYHVQATLSFSPFSGAISDLCGMSLADRPDPKEGYLSKWIAALTSCFILRHSA